MGYNSNFKGFMQQFNEKGGLKIVEIKPNGMITLKSTTTGMKFSSHKDKLRPLSEGNCSREETAQAQHRDALEQVQRNAGKSAEKYLNLVPMKDVPKMRESGREKILELLSKSPEVLNEEEAAMVSQFIFLMTGEVIKDNDKLKKLMEDQQKLKAGRAAEPEPTSLLARFYDGLTSFCSKA